MKTHIQEPYLDPSSDNPCNGEIRNEVETSIVTVTVTIDGKVVGERTEQILTEESQQCIDEALGTLHNYHV